MNIYSKRSEKNISLVRFFRLKVSSLTQDKCGDQIAAAECEIIDLDSGFEFSTTHGNLTMRKCSMGHSVLSRIEKFECQFCRDLLCTYRAYALRNGGTLVSRVPERNLRFRCHRKHHVEFIVSAKSLKSWCPQCNPDKVREFLLPSVSIQKCSSSHLASDASSLEEGKRRQANLLLSAKLLYKMNNGKTTSCTLPVNIARKVRLETQKDLLDFPDVPEKQSVVIRSLLNTSKLSNDKTTQWKLVAQSVNVDMTIGLEKLYRLAAKLVHPDKCKHPLADEAFKILSSL